jgi:hypothetical protein
MSHYATVIVNGGRDYRQEALASVEDRMESFTALLRHLRDNERVALRAVVFPAGFFCVRSEEAVDRLAARVTTALASEGGLGFMVVWGIDGWVDGGRTGLQRGPTGYPFFVYALRPGQTAPDKFQQLSISSAEDPSAGDMWGTRMVCCDYRTALLICGESWGDALLRRVEVARPQVLLVPAHWKVNMRRDRKGMGRMSWHLRLNEFSKRSGITVVLAEHTRSPERHDYGWGARSVRTIDLPGSLTSLFTVKLVEV